MTDCKFYLNTKVCKFNKEDWLQQPRLQSNFKKIGDEVEDSSYSEKMRWGRGCDYKYMINFFYPCPHKLQKLVL